MLCDKRKGGQKPKLGALQSPCGLKWLQWGFTAMGTCYGMFKESKMQEERCLGDLGKSKSGKIKV